MPSFAASGSLKLYLALIGALLVIILLTVFS
jgi:hypothetical protein